MVPIYVPKDDTSFLWLTPAFSCFSLLLQLYVVWLILNKSPENMWDYRFFLCANAASDMAITVVIGFLIVPDNWMPEEIGATVYGLGRLFGERGGEITVRDHGNSYPPLPSFPWQFLPFPVKSDLSCSLCSIASRPLWPGNGQSCTRKCH